MGTTRILLVLVLLSFGLPSPTSYSEEISANEAKLPRNPGFFVTEFTKNSPQVHTDSRVRGRHLTYSLGYRKLLYRQWLMGLHLNFRSFTRRDKNQELTFFTLRHESLYNYRISLKSRLLIGGSLVYMLPSQRSTLPLEKDADFTTEVGVGAVVIFTQALSEDYFLTLRIERWRGTVTGRFHALETAVGLMVSI